MEITIRNSGFTARRFWEKDIEYFKKAKINEVSLGIFSWAVLEPVEGEFHFEWMEKIIDRLYENGISTILANPDRSKTKMDGTEVS